MKRIASVNLQTTNRDELEILNFGSLNKYYKGPDFKMAKIKLFNLILVGQIEIHVKSSDWYRHNHHKDENYNNVILHVVFEHDMEIVQNGRELPTLEIAQYIDQQHYTIFLKNRLKQTAILCEATCAQLPSVFIESMKAKALEERFQEKLALIENESTISESELLFKLLASAFGTKVNKSGFERLTDRLNYSDIRCLERRQRYNLILSESGAFTKPMDSENNIEQGIWNFKGTRPVNFPTARVKQFAQLVCDVEIDYLIQLVDSKRVIDFFQLALHKSFNEKGIKLSRFMFDQLMINCLSPFLWMLGEKRENQRLKDRAIEVLNMTRAEMNRNTRVWKMTDLKMKNAYDTQSLLALQKRYCSQKKCLSCEVGNALLKA